MKIRAITHVCKQISIDDFETQVRVMDLTPETTIKDIYDWYSGLINNTTAVIDASGNLVIQFEPETKVDPDINKMILTDQFGNH